MEAIEVLRSAISGGILLQDDQGYDETRRVHNGLIDKHPMVIARCRASSDIVAAIAFARSNGLEISVRGGGHNVAGRAVTEGGVMIDLSAMKGIDVDADARTAHAEAGVLWSELNDATHAHGLATTGGVISTTGIAGLTLGGGLGWLMPRFGLAADNLVSADMVTADGEILAVDADNHPDLFWALRGGGGNFGVVASFTYRLHPIRDVIGGLVAHPFDAAGETLRFYRGFTGSISDDLMAVGALVHAPDGSGTPLAAMVVCHAGPPEEAEAELAPLVGFGEPALVQVGPMPYPQVNKLLDDGYPRGALNYWKSSFLSGLDDALIDTLVERFPDCPSPMTAIVFEHFHGSVTRVGVTDTPVPHREPGYNMVITSVWTDPATTEANIAWTRGLFDAISPSLAGRRWLNYLVDDDGDEAVRQAYGVNHARLADVKRRYDPENVFRLNHNIAPTAA